MHAVLTQIFCKSVAVLKQRPLRPLRGRHATITYKKTFRQVGLHFRLQNLSGSSCRENIKGIYIQVDYKHSHYTDLKAVRSWVLLIKRNFKIYIFCEKTTPSVKSATDFSICALPRRFIVILIIMYHWCVIEFMNLCQAPVTSQIRRRTASNIYVGDKVAYETLRPPFNFRGSV